MKQPILVVSLLLEICARRSSPDWSWNTRKQLAHKNNRVLVTQPLISALQIKLSAKLNSPLRPRSKLPSLIQNQQGFGNSRMRANLVRPTMFLYILQCKSKTLCMLIVKTLGFLSHPLTKQDQNSFNSQKARKQELRIPKLWWSKMGTTRTSSVRYQKKMMAAVTELKVRVLF